MLHLIHTNNDANFLSKKMNNEFEFMQSIIKNGSNVTLLHRFQLYLHELSIKPKRSIPLLDLNTITENEFMTTCYGSTFFVRLQSSQTSEKETTHTALSVNNFVGFL